MDDRLVIQGSFARDTIVEWINHRAGRLSLEHMIHVVGPSRIDVDVSGPDALIDAMALACSLGPASALIDSVTRENETEVLLQ